MNSQHNRFILVLLPNALQSGLYDRQRMNALHLDSCPVCTGCIALWRFKTTLHGIFPICRCRDCGMAFVNPRPSLQFLMDYYRAEGSASHPGANGVSLAWVLNEEREFPNSTIDAREIISQVCAHSKVAVDRRAPMLLDIGSGFGFFTRQARQLGFEVTAIELGPARQVSIEMTGVVPHDVPFENFDARPGSFSAIVMSQVMEHVQDVNLWAQRAYELLQPGGVLAIALPHFNSATRRLMGENDPFITPPEHLNFFTAASLRQLLIRHGFELGATEYRSRIPPRAIERRLGKAGRHVVAAGRLAGTALAHTMDKLRLGMMVRIYGIKPLHSPA
jgi:SAM-dependent methyltransferase